jgi:sec-independent protein translocase protein TatB
MFDVGFAELFLLGLIGLLVLGPERLPGVARTIGGFIRKARVSWTSLRKTIVSELNEADLSDPIKKAGEDFRQIGRKLADTSSFRPDQMTPATTNEPVEPNVDDQADTIEPDSEKPRT